MTRVFQLSPQLAAADAVGHQILEIASLLRAANVETFFVADTWDRRLTVPVLSPTEFVKRVRADDVAVLHLCSCGEVNRIARDLPCRVVMYYHNITPAAFYIGLEPPVASCLHQARQQLRALRGMGRAIAGSEYNQREIEQLGFDVIGVAPYVMLLDELHAGQDGTIAAEARQRFERPGQVTWLSVGRLAPNKRLDDVVRAFAYYHGHIQPASQLILVGRTDGHDRAVAEIRRAIHDNGVEDSVVLAGQLPLEALGAIFRLADVYVCLSEHEGFCIPLVEAMSFDLPVVAFNSTAIPGTLGDSGVLLHEKAPALVAETIHTLLGDPALRDGVIAQQRRRMADFAPAVAREKLRSVLSLAGLPLPIPAGSSAQGSTA